ncbi:MAG: hypothetical protein NVSMB62_26230 [Acidobacteriaceae bacterium]
MKCASREMKTAHSCFQKGLRCGLYRAVLPYLTWSHFGITGRLGASKPLQLYLSRTLHSCPYGGRPFRRGEAGKFFVLYSWYLHMHINAIQKRPGDLALVAKHCVLGARTFTIWI